jgi:hypothetical protein
MTRKVPCAISAMHSCEIFLPTRYAKSASAKRILRAIVFAQPSLPRMPEEPRMPPVPTSPVDLVIYLRRLLPDETLTLSMVQAALASGECGDDIVPEITMIASVLKCRTEFLGGSQAYVRITRRTV